MKILKVQKQLDTETIRLLKIKMSKRKKQSIKNTQI